MNQDIKDDLIIHETWSSTSENWEQSSHLLQSLLYTIKFALSVMKYQVYIIGNIILILVALHCLT